MRSVLIRTEIEHYFMLTYSKTVNGIQRLLMNAAHKSTQIERETRKEEIRTDLVLNLKYNTIKSAHTNWTVWSPFKLHARVNIAMCWERERDREKSIRSMKFGNLFQIQYFRWMRCWCCVIVINLLWITIKWK